MRLLVELDSDEAARAARADLKAAGFPDASIQLDHPFEGGCIVSVEAWGEDLNIAAEVLNRYERQVAPNMFAP